MTLAAAGSEAFELDGLDEALRSALRGRPFRSSQRLSAMLAYVVAETLAGRGDLLRERTIAVEALGRPSTFDPRFDPMVRVMASRLRKALDRYYAGDGADDPVCIEMPKGGYAVRARPATQPPTVVRHPGGPVLAVASFADLTDDPELGHLAVGLTEAVVANLATFQGFRTIGPIGPAPSSDEARWAQEVGRTLGATHVLQGTARTAGRILRVAVRLADGVTGQLLWSTLVDHPLDGHLLFAVEDRIARQVSGTLGDYGGVVHRYRMPDPGRTAGSYDAMLRFYSYLSTLDPEAAVPTRDALTDAVERDPDDALLLAMLAGMTLFHGVGRLGELGAAGMTEQEVDRAEALARRSLEHQPANAHATTVLAFVALVRGDRERARLHLDRVLDVCPANPSLLFMVGVGHTMLGEWETGVHHIQESLDLNPMHPGWCHGFLVLDALVHDDPDAALAAARQVETPGLVWGPILRAAALSAAGRLPEAAAELARLEGDALVLPDPEGERDAFVAHLRLPEEVTSVLIGHLARIPASTTA